jgi:hypothetical protein
VSEDEIRFEVNMPLPDLILSIPPGPPRDPANAMKPIPEEDAGQVGRVCPECYSFMKPVDGSSKAFVCIHCGCSWGAA